MDVDPKRKLALMSRDPRRTRGSTSRSRRADPNGATNIAGVYVVDAKDPEGLQLLSFQQLPTGHTTTCVNDCEWLWTGGPAHHVPAGRSGWTFGRPIIVTDLSNPRNPQAYPTAAGRPVPARRRHRLLARRPGRRHGHRLGLRRRRHARLLDRWPPLRPVPRREAARHAARPDPVRRRRPAGVRHRRHDRRLRAQRLASGRRDARADPRYRTASCCWRPRRTSVRPRRRAGTAASSRSRRWRAASTARPGARRRSAVPPEGGRHLEPVREGGLAPGRGRIHPLPSSAPPTTSTWTAAR